MIGPAPTISETCPWCGERFYAIAPHDPLKRHLDYCEARPADDDDEGPAGG